MNHKLLNNRGFTLIELIVVIAIIAILAAIAISSYIGCVETAHCAACVSNRANMKRNLIICNIEDYGGALSLEEVYALPEMQNELEQYTCPSKGTLYVSGDELCCTVHDGENAGGDGNTDSGSETTPGLNENHSYDADRDYYEDTKYEYGEIVNCGGILYRCLRPEKSASDRPGVNDNGFNTWQVVGAVKDFDVKFNAGHNYAVGTIVKGTDDNYYMFTPPFNDINYSHYSVSDASVWTKIDDHSSVEKPPMIEKAPSGVKSYISGTIYSQGDYCVLNGVLYEHTGAASSRSPSDYYAVKDGIWTQVSSVYVWENARYNVGDKVWYKGQYYTATDNFTTYASHTLPNTNSKYWELSN